MTQSAASMQVFECFRRPTEGATARVKASHRDLWLALGWEEAGQQGDTVVLRWERGGEPPRPAPPRCSSCQGRQRCPTCWDLQPDAVRNCQSCGGRGTCRGCGGTGVARPVAKQGPVIEIPF